MRGRRSLSRSRHPFSISIHFHPKIWDLTPTPETPFRWHTYQYQHLLIIEEAGGARRLFSKELGHFVARAFQEGRFFSHLTPGFRPFAMVSPSNLSLSECRYQSDMVVVLDMDQTLLNTDISYITKRRDDYAKELRQEYPDTASSSKSKVHFYNLDLEVDGTTLYMLVMHRPGLKEFIKEVCERYETHVWTKGHPTYANALLDSLDPTGEMFAGRWFGDKTDNWGRKDLNNIPGLADRLSKTVLVEDDPFGAIVDGFPNVSNDQTSNALTIPKFFVDPTDNALPKVLQMLKDLEDLEDVRPVLKASFDVAKCAEQGKTVHISGHTQTSAKSGKPLLKKYLTICGEIKLG